MLTKESLQDILAEGHQIDDSDFVDHMIENMRRNIFLMAQILSERQYLCIESSELQERITEDLRRRGASPHQQRFNSVDWLSAEWTKFEKPNDKPSEYFDPAYTEIFVRDGIEWATYRLNPKWHDDVVNILAGLESTPGIPKGANTDASDDASEDHDTPSAETQDPTPEPIEPPDALDDIEARRLDLEKLSPKDRATIQKARIGQGVFRDRLRDHWGDACAVTGCNQIDLLVASHIKPWRVCTNREALDETNGLLLVPNLDRAFDRGLVSFDDEGRILRSPHLPKEAAADLGISDDMKLRHICPHHQPYLR